VLTAQSLPMRPMVLPGRHFFTQLPSATYPQYGVQRADMDSGPSSVDFRFSASHRNFISLVVTKIWTTDLFLLESARGKAAIAEGKRLHSRRTSGRWHHLLALTSIIASENPIICLPCVTIPLIWRSWRLLLLNRQ